MDPIDVILKSLQAVTGIAGAFIAYFIFSLGRQQRTDTWFRSFNELHQAFWTDEDFREVRSWIANDQKYGDLDRILAKRLAGRNGLSAAEYESLEKLDKFFNFLLRAREVASQVRGHDDLWDRLYFQYWLDDIVRARRHRLWRYFELFYKATADLPMKSVRSDPAFSAEVHKMCEQTTQSESLR